MTDGLFQTLRPRLVSLAYRITGSRADAEDIVQETALRWLNADQSDIRSPEAFLTTITTRLSLNHLRDRKARGERYQGDWLPEPVDTSAESRVELLNEISFGFMTLLERLTPLQRAVFILRSAFDCSYEDIASVVGRDEAACRKTFSRARAALELARPVRTAPEAECKALLMEFLKAAEQGDMAGLARLLAHDVVMRGDGGARGPALKRPLHGRAAVAKFVIASRALLPAGAVLAIRGVNGSHAAVFCVGDRCVLTIMIECTDDLVIDHVFAVSNSDKLKAVVLN